jgi:hypothetical protein
MKLGESGSKGWLGKADVLADLPKGHTKRLADCQDILHLTDVPCWF